MKTQEELNTLKEEVETLNNKLSELSEEEMEQLSGGMGTKICPFCGCSLPESTLFAMIHVKFHIEKGR